MQTLLNPRVAYCLLRGYLRDKDRVWRAAREDIRRLQNRALRRMVRYAYQVPLYRQKYRDADVHPDDIAGVADIKKLPCVTKDDLRRHFPDGIVHPGFDTGSAHLVSTSGSTGQPVSLYMDSSAVIKALFGFLREIQEYGVHWRKTRMSVIADVEEHAVEEAYLQGSVMPAIRKLFPLDNLQILHVGDEPRDLIRRIDAFEPEFLGGYPGVLRALAVLKRRGYGEHIAPRVMSSSGAVLDDYTRRYIEDAFAAPIYDVYGSTEAGPVAFECRSGHYHIHSDLVYLEFLGEDGHDVAPGEPGRLVITRLYGRGTPIIRYTGMDDILVPLEESCRCGINTPVIGRVGGRKVDAIVLPDGEIIPPFSITGIPGEVMKQYETDKIKQFQIVQESFDELSFRIVIDDELRDVGPSLDTISEEIRRVCRRKVGPDMTVTVTEVERIGSGETSKPPVLVSKVNH
ncbi:MAG: hypothetical protein R6U10_06865 [Thermoplasmatota archaeon]